MATVIEDAQAKTKRREFPVIFVEKGVHIYALDDANKSEEIIMLPKEYNWLLSHPEIEAKYPGEYIAIVGESVVAHGKDFKEVLKVAEKNGKEPFIHKVPSYFGAIRCISELFNRI